jgi:hypothetical protein
MTQYKKITREEVIEALEKEFKIKDIKFMRTNYSEHDCELIEEFVYIEGESNSE